VSQRGAAGRLRLAAVAGVLVLLAAGVGLLDGRSSAQDPRGPDPFALEVAAASRDLAKLEALLTAAAAAPVLTDHVAGARYIFAATTYAAAREESSAAGAAADDDLVDRLRPAFECARHWARASGSQQNRRVAADNAAWLGSSIVDLLRARGVPVVDVLALADSIPAEPGQFNGVVASVARADLRIELGRTGDAQVVLDGIDAKALAGEDRTNGDALVAACRADLDVRLGNHDEALRRILPWLQRVGLRTLVELRVRRSHVGYLMGAARFDEVSEHVAAAKAALPLTAAETELFDLCDLAARSACADFDPESAPATGATLQRIASGPGPAYVRRWAAVLRAQLALRRGGDAGATAALGDARAVCAGADDLATWQCLETTAAALLLRAHRRGAANAAQLRRQLAVLDELWRDMRRERDRAPVRPSGVAFLHYAFRRDVLAQRVGLTLALDDSQSAREAAVELLLSDREDHTALVTMRARALTGDDHGVLLYLPGGDASYVFAFDRRGITWHVLERTVELHAHMRDLADAIDDALALTEATPGTDLEARRTACLARIEDAGASLGGKLLPPDVREAMRGWRRASLLGTEMLPLVPFECLPYDGEPLGHRLAIDRWPTADFAVERAAAATHEQPLRLSFFGRIARAPGRAGLVAADVATDVGAFVEPAIWLESECTMEKLAASGPVDVLVVLAHGERTAERVRPLVLRFADGALGCEEVERLRAGFRFVVLAACNAALGPNRFGASARADLTGAFLQRGATCVVASPFALRLAPVRVLLAESLTAVAGGAAPAEAMRLARVALARRASTLQERLDVWTTGSLAAFGYGQRPLR
jgi:hypothetical protein